MTTAAKKKPPSWDAERSVAGCFLLDERSVFRALAEGLQPGDFESPTLRTIATVCFELVHTGATVDAVTISNALQRQGQLQVVGGMAAVVALGETVATASNVAYYSKLVRDAALQRRAVASMRDLLERAEQLDATSLIAAMNASVLDLSSKNTIAKPESAEQAASATLKELETEAEAKMPAGVATGLRIFDRAGGLHRGDMTIVGGRPSTGKTACALEAALTVGLQGGNVFFSSHEMPRKKLYRRLIAHRSGVGMHLLRDARRFRDNADAWIDIGVAVRELVKTSMTTWCPGSATSADLRVRAKLAHAVRPLDLIVVDYVQLLAGAREEERHHQVAAISRDLKSLAVETNACMLVLSQLSRANADGVPQLRDLRDSGSLEQDADQVLLLHRTGDETATSFDLDMIMAKDRDGEVGSVACRFHGQTQRFEDL